MKRFTPFFTLIISILFFVSSCQEKPKKVLPYIGHYDIEYKNINGKEIADTIYPKIPFFTYLNQDSAWIKSSDYKGKVWIANFFFTSCPTICPKMTQQMKRLTVKNKDIENEIQFFSFSINPDNDQPTVLKRFMKHHGIEAKNWLFLTGNPEEEVHFLGDQHFLVNARPDLGSEGGYAHSEAFVLIDKEGYIRGMYNGTDTKEVDKLHSDLRKLLKYEYGVTIRD